MKIFARSIFNKINFNYLEGKDYWVKCYWCQFGTSYLVMVKILKIQHDLVKCNIFDFNDSKYFSESMSELESKVNNSATPFKWQLITPTRLGTNSIEVGIATPLYLCTNEELLELAARRFVLL